MILKNSKVCCFSDLHLGVHQNSTQWHEIAIDFGKWMKNKLKENHIKDIIFCGDLLHYRDEIAVNTIQVTSEFLNLLKDFNIIMIPGNHDCYFKHNSSVHSLSILKGYKNITVLDKTTTETFFGKKLTFCPWGTEIADIPESNIVFGHFEIATFKLNETKVCEHGMTSENLLSKSPLIISGHFHTRQEREYSNGKIIYLGSPFHMDFGDTGQRGITYLDIENNNMTFEANLESPCHIKLPLSFIKGDHITIDKDFVSKNFIKVIVDTNYEPEEVEAVIKNLNSLDPSSVTIDYKYNTAAQKIVSDVDFASVDIADAIKEFINKLEIENKKDIIDYTLELYQKSK